MAGVIARAPLRLGRLIPQSTCLFLCDLQEKFRNNIQYFPEIVEVSGRLLKAFKVLELPVVATEQYPKGEQATYYYHYIIIIIIFIIESVVRYQRERQHCLVTLAKLCRVYSLAHCNSLTLNHIDM